MRQVVRIGQFTFSDSLFYPDNGPDGVWTGNIAMIASISVTATPGGGQPDVALAQGVPSPEFSTFPSEGLGALRNAWVTQAALGYLPSCVLRYRVPAGWRVLRSYVDGNQFWAEITDEAAPVYASPWVEQPDTPFPRPWQVPGAVLSTPQVSSTPKNCGTLGRLDLSLGGVSARAVRWGLLGQWATDAAGQSWPAFADQSAQGQVLPGTLPDGTYVVTVPGHQPAVVTVGHCVATTVSFRETSSAQTFVPQAGHGFHWHLRGPRAPLGRRGLSGAEDTQRRHQDGGAVREELDRMVIYP